MRQSRAGSIAAIAVLAVAVAWSASFTVHQTQQALLVRLGEPVRTITEPGLHFKVPFIDSVISIDKRILDLEVPAQEIIASDQKRLVISSFARYRVLDPLKFYQAVGSVDEANSRLSVMLIAALRRILGEASFVQILRTERTQLMSSMREQLDREAGSLGISIVDVRIHGANLPEQNSQAIYQRMQTERQQEAAMYRAEGSQRSQEIRAKADRDATVLVAEATSESERLRGDGDAERNRIFADAFGRDPEFAAFYRSMQAYDAALRHDTTRMLLRSNSEFFRYFVDPSGKK
jgi:membrane protease subunit HflC